MQITVTMIITWMGGLVADNGNNDNYMDGWVSCR